MVFVKFKNLPTPRLASCDLGSRNSVACESTVDVCSVSRVGCLDVSRDLGCRGKCLRASASDLDLGTRDVELIR
jgi:hypothetical protein